MAYLCKFEKGKHFCMSLGRKVSFPQYLHIPSFQLFHSNRICNSVLSIKRGSWETIFVTDAISNNLTFTYSEDGTPRVPSVIPGVSYKNGISDTRF